MLWRQEPPASALGFGADAKDAVKRAHAHEAGHQWHNANQLSIVSKTAALIHEEPAKQGNADDDAGNTVKCAFVCGEHGNLPICINWKTSMFAERIN